MYNNKILEDLEFYLKKSGEVKSSHWEKNLKDAEYRNIENNFGFGCWEKTKSFLKIPYFILQRLTYGNSIFKSKEYNLFKSMCDIQKRNVDNDVIRHIFTFNFLDKQNLLNERICVIGDGKANFVGGLIQLKNDDIKIFSINLTEVLIHDYLIIKNTGLLEDDKIVVVNKEEDLNLPNKKLYLIDASNVSFLKDKNINLFANLIGMQEMKSDHLKNYFNIIESNKAHFYCCNREKYIMPAGEETNFDNYPWGNCSKILFENCPWHQIYYELRFPFIKKYETNIKHALVKY